MTRSTLHEVMPHVFKHEGGYVDHLQDPGGATKYGITIGTLRDWRGDAVSKGDVKALTQAEATEIYRARYWDAIKGDDLPTGVDYAVFDFAINSGPRRAAQYLQRVVGVEDDGKIGPVTLKAVRLATASDTIDLLCDARLKFLKGLSTWDTFGKGWSRRVADVRGEAHRLANTTVPAPPPDIEPPAEPEPAGFWNALVLLIAKLFGGVK